MTFQSSPTPLKIDKIGKNYAVELYCGDVNLSNYVNRVRIVNSINSRWPRVIIEINSNSSEIISNEIYGRDDLYLRITVSGPSQQIIEESVYYLMYMESNVSLIPKDDRHDVWDQRQPIMFTTIPTYSVNVLGSFINLVLDQDNHDNQLINTEDPTILGIFKNIYTKYLGFSNNQLYVDSTGQNSDVIDSFVVPPMSLRQMINYFNEKFSFYNQGSLFYYCDKDGILRLWNLLNRCDKNAVFTIHQLPSSIGDSDKIQQILEDEVDDDVFYTSSPINTINISNSIVMKKGWRDCYVGKPTDDLYRLYCSGVDDSSLTIDHHPFLKARKKYYSNITSFSTSTVKNTVDSNFKDLVKLNVTLGGTLLMKNLVKVGEPVELKPKNVLYMPYQGKYILDSSDYFLTREESNNWTASCKLVLFRPYQIENQPDVNVRRC